MTDPIVTDLQLARARHLSLTSPIRRATQWAVPSQQDRPPPRGAPLHARAHEAKLPCAYEPRALSRGSSGPGIVERPGRPA